MPCRFHSRRLSCALCRGCASAKGGTRQGPARRGVTRYAACARCQGFAEPIAGSCAGLCEPPAGSTPLYPPVAVRRAHPAPPACLPRSTPRRTRSAGSWSTSAAPAGTRRTRTPASGACTATRCSTRVERSRWCCRWGQGGLVVVGGAVDFTHGLCRCGRQTELGRGKCRLPAGGSRGCCWRGPALLWGCPRASQRWRGNVGTARGQRCVDS